MLLVDTGPLVAYINRKDPDHEACAALFASRTDDLLITPYVLTEVSSADLVRVTELARQYRSFPLGITDASVIATAERLGLREVATLDHRHFRAVRPKHCEALSLLR
jgi:uncharacterized protein